MINSLEREHTLKAGRAIGARFTALTGARVIDPGFNSTFIEPESDTSAIRESFVIVFPVTDAVLLFVFSHKLNITALSHPCYLCSNARERGVAA